MHSKSSFLKFLVCLLFVFLLANAVFAADWEMLGPEGGDVRSLSYDPANPSRILLGTSAGQIFQSLDGGASWAPFVHLGPGDDYVLDHIIFNPSHPETIYVAGWSLFNNDEGDVFRSDDGGKTWKMLKGVHNKSVRAMTMAPSDPNILVIGALDGVFRSTDGGANWDRISPEHHSDIKNIESVAIDPVNPDIIYAGTFHLPWKTEDGGKNWHSITEGWLLDSDVFSIIIDPKAPSTVFASACSGIYKSVNSGDVFKRIQGIPHSAIRTRVLKQDPKRPSIVYAGTTGGLWKTFDGGTRWELYSAPDVIVNDILIDPQNPDHVLLATDRGGVLSSKNGFDTYVTSNKGFAHRVVGSVIADRKDPSRLYVGVLNDHNLGGFFMSSDSGRTWKQSNQGLGERDVISLTQAEDGTIFAGTNHGIFYQAKLNGPWQPAMMILGPVPPPEEKPAPAPKYKKAGHTASTVHSKSASTHAAASKKPPEMVIPAANAPRVQAFAVTDAAWYAVTNDGLFTSVDHGRKWYGQPVMDEKELLSISTGENGWIAVVSPQAPYLSTDGGKTWSKLETPKWTAGVFSLNIAPDSSLWLGTRGGALHSTDGGKSWEHVLNGLPAMDVLLVRYDPHDQRLLATVMNGHSVYESLDNGKTWQKTSRAEVSIRNAFYYQGKLLAASSYNGLLLQESADTTAASNSAAAGVSGVSTQP